MDPSECDTHNALPLTGFGVNVIELHVTHALSAGPQHVAHVAGWAAATAARDNNARICVHMTAST